MLAFIGDYGFYFVRVFITVFRPFVNIALDAFYWLLHGKSKPLPPIDNEILLMSATELAEKIRKKELSAESVMEAYIFRIMAVQPILNACTDNRFEDALADARAVDKMLEIEIRTEAELAKAKPLLGVPFTCKEIVGVKDLSQTWGIMRFKDRKAPEDSYAAAQYKKAGAIPIVVTNIPTMSVWWDTSNRVFGSTKNPYNNNRSPGGSSGGESALISSAGAVIGIGTDLAGSIRIPASFCGIYGHKPSPGIISNKSTWPEMPNTRDAIKNLDRYISTGPMCRYSEDLRLLFKVLCGNNYKNMNIDQEVDFRNVSVYYIEEFPGFLLSATSDIKDSVLKAVKYFEETYGATTSKLEIKELKYAFRIWESKLFEAGCTFRSVEPDIQGFFNELRELFKSLLGYSDYDLRILYHACLEFQEKNKFYEKCIGAFDEIKVKLDEILDGNAILIVPTHPEPPPHPIVTIPKFENIAYTCIFNVLDLPATSVPAGQSNGLPIGLQVIGKKYNDHLTIAAAVELHKVFGGWRDPTPAASV